MFAAADAPHQMLMTISVAIAAGVMLIVLARRLNLPGLVLLLAGGMVLGPGVLGVVHPSSLGDGLQVIVALSIGLILFEGGLTLELDGFRSAPTMIRRLLSIGVMVTWFGTALAIWLIADIEPSYAIIAASMVIVTGPTVIAPLLKRINLAPKLHSILHWEGVLIDPIGVFIALLCFEWITQERGQMALLSLGIRVAWGLAVGVVGGVSISYLVRRKQVPEDTINVFALGFAVLVFGLAEAVQSEAGLLAVTVAGFVFGLTGGARLKQVRRFKAELTDLLIGTLFILLAARLSFGQFESFGLRGAAVVAVVIFVLRPLSIALCSHGLGLGRRERLFLSWVAPRGIVAASMASLFAISLERVGTVQDPRFIETFTYSVIIATIVLQGLTAGPLARVLNLKRTEPTGWLIVGGHQFARRVARFINRAADLQTVLVDTNARAIREAQTEGLQALVADARETALLSRPGLEGIGSVLALTDNEDLNVRLCQIWGNVVGSDRVFRWDPSSADHPEDQGQSDLPGRVLWPRLPRPSLLSGELQRGEAVMREVRGPEPLSAHLSTTIIWVRGGQLILNAGRAPDGEPGEDDWVLFLQREAEYLARSVRPELVVTLTAKNLRELFESLVESVIRVHPGLPREPTVEELLARESAFPTALGHGVAVPHTYSSAVDERLCVVAHLPEGLEFGAHDGEPVRLVFLLLSPHGDPEGHLATLAEISRLVIDPDTRRRLIDAPTPLALIRIIQDAGQGRSRSSG